MINIIVCGAAGRMGSSIIRLAKEEKNINIVAGTEIDNSPLIGSKNPLIIKSSELESVLDENSILVDFTTPANTMKNIELAIKKNAKMAIGTTGIYEGKSLEQLKEAGKKIPVVASPNMSVGINILIDLVKDLAKKIPDYDIEVVEIHHNKKKDSPSGTALRLAEAVAAGHEKNLNDVGTYGRHGLDTLRRHGEIGIHAVRCGDVVGEHTIYFAGNGERIEVSHKASSRDNLAAGAIKAVKWIADKPAGLYDMQDVLNLK